jgi:hypothetical protein
MFTRWRTPFKSGQAESRRASPTSCRVPCSCKSSPQVVSCQAELCRVGRLCTAPCQVVRSVSHELVSYQAAPHSAICARLRRVSCAARFNDTRGGWSRGSSAQRTHASRRRLYRCTPMHIRMHTPTDTLCTPPCTSLCTILCTPLCTPICTSLRIPYVHPYVLHCAHAYVHPYARWLPTDDARTLLGANLKHKRGTRLGSKRACSTTRRNRVRCPAS